MQWCKFCGGSEGTWLWLSYPKPHDRFMKCGKCGGTGLQSEVDRLLNEREEVTT